MSLSINGTRRVTASLAGAGYLSAHLNMRDRPKEGTVSSQVRFSAQDTSNETETVSLEWPEIDLEIGDAVELRILPDGDGDPPSKIGKSSEAPSNLFSNVDLARDLLQSFSEFNERLMHVLSRSEKAEPPDEHKKFTQALAYVLAEIGFRFVYPVYRRHKELVPDSMKGEIL
jgi:hypothetical protein